MKEKCAAYFTPRVFLKFPRDPLGRISANALFRYIIKKAHLTRLRISLTCYDEVGQGYLREQDLENYVFEQIPSLPQLLGLERFSRQQQPCFVFMFFYFFVSLFRDFYPYYVFTAVRKFIFFLDHKRIGKISINDIVNSPILHQFNALRKSKVGVNHCELCLSTTFF